MHTHRRLPLMQDKEGQAAYTLIKFDELVKQHNTARTQNAVMSSMPARPAGEGVQSPELARSSAEECIDELPDGVDIYLYAREL